MENKATWSTLKRVMVLAAIAIGLLVSRQAATLGNPLPGKSPAGASGKTLLKNRPSDPPPSESVLYSFPGIGRDVYPGPNGLIADGTGNWYGTTYLGGTGQCSSGGIVMGCGTVFELSPQSGGGWTETVLYSFQGTPDGNNPASKLVFDHSGNLYGTTMYGGSCTGNSAGCGIVFELSPQAGGGWTETIILNFVARHGSNPYGTLTFDATGNLYGTTVYGGMGVGVVFELSPQSGGGWAETVLHTFENDHSDGDFPESNVIFDTAGNLYGTTNTGGTGTCPPRGCGTVFELSPQSGGVWTETILHSFQTGGQDGLYPVGGLAIDGSSNLYGTTVSGGGVGCKSNQGCGTVFELSLQSGSWTETLLHRFGGSDGEQPSGYLIFNTAGNLFGVTSGNSADNYGNVFELRQGSRGWSTHIIYTFHPAGHNAITPSFAGLTLDTAGNIYGTSSSGGTGSGCQHGCGTAYEITP
jgi:uncharacterized repeat protein (TIGR03803 family)